MTASPGSMRTAGMAELGLKASAVSHGVRLVAGTMIVDGREMSVQEVLADPELSKLLSDEGAIRQPRYRT